MSNWAIVSLYTVYILGQLTKARETLELAQKINRRGNPGQRRVLLLVTFNQSHLPLLKASWSGEYFQTRIRKAENINIHIMAEVKEVVKTFQDKILDEIPGQNMLIQTSCR